jgi:hypothetical protein
MNERTVAWIGGVGGGVLGVLGGAIGTYFSIRNTSGPRERAFMIRMALACWAVVTAFLGLMWLTPTTFRPLLWIPYALLLPLAIPAANRRQEKIRRQEALDCRKNREEPPLTEHERSAGI